MGKSHFPSFSIFADDATRSFPTIRYAGTYRHFKGKFYQVIGTATHSETLETLVVYVPLYGEGKLWVRPLASFMEKVMVAGKEVPRFEWVVSSER